ncbi:hypothetical protein E5288_WYG003963 [Bos mutus]|uniref:Uncharacterized protein n=1 Tax=Bos mutus TaxID=72004 RepID=A0A6B0S8Q1_9CETA|nr:hypothetical protein [Bos mutus]
MIRGLPAREERGQVPGPGARIGMIRLRPCVSRPRPSSTFQVLRRWSAHRQVNIHGLDAMDTHSLAFYSAFPKENYILIRWPLSPLLLLEGIELSELRPVNTWTAPSPISGPRGPPEQHGLCQQQPQPTTRLPQDQGPGRCPPSRCVTTQSGSRVAPLPPANSRTGPPLGARLTYRGAGLPLCWQRQALIEKMLGHSEELTASGRAEKGDVPFKPSCSSAAPGRACKSRNFRRDAQRRSCLGARSQEAVCPSAPASPRRLP